MVVAFVVHRITLDERFDGTESILGETALDVVVRRNTHGRCHASQASEESELESLQSRKMGDDFVVKEMPIDQMFRVLSREI